MTTTRRIKDDQIITTELVIFKHQSTKNCHHYDHPLGRSTTSRSHSQDNETLTHHPRTYNSIFRLTMSSHNRRLLTMATSASKSTSFPTPAYHLPVFTKHNNKLKNLTTMLLFIAYIMATSLPTTLSSTTNGHPDTGIRFDPEASAYSGLTFSFDPRLDKQQVERLHFDHWHSIMHQSSSLLYEVLNGRAHFAEVRVLIPYKWRNFEWPVLHKPGSPIIANRRLRFSDSDVIVGQDGK